MRPSAQSLSEILVSAAASIARTASTTMATLQFRCKQAVDSGANAIIGRDAVDNERRPLLVVEFDQ